MALTDLVPFRRQRQHGGSVPAGRTAQDPFISLQDEMNRLFDDFLPGFTRGRDDLAAFPGGSWDFSPDVDVKETRKDIRVSVELPGVEEKDIDVRLDGSVLRISGEKREEKTEKEGTWTCSECCYGSFTRSVPLSTDVDAERAEATFKKGVLKVTLPKTRPSEGGGRITVRTE